MPIPSPLPLQRLHRTTGYNLRPVFASELARSALGFPVSPVNSMGDHWALEVAPSVMATLCGRTMLADMVQGVGRRIRVPIPQKGVEIGLPGGTEPVPHGDGAFFDDGAGYAPVTPYVDGSGQAGSTLALQGAAPGYVVRKGLFFTLITKDGSSAHLITEPSTVDGDGRVVVSFWPMLWREPADGDHVEMFEPFIEGLVVEQGGQSSGIFRAVSTDTFVIEEAG